MRHIFKCVECGADFVKVDAGVRCELCRNKPVEIVSEDSEAHAKKQKKASKSAGGE